MEENLTIVFCQISRQTLSVRPTCREIYRATRNNLFVSELVHKKRIAERILVFNIELVGPSL